MGAGDRGIEREGKGEEGGGGEGTGKGGEIFRIYNKILIIVFSGCWLRINQVLMDCGVHIPIALQGVFRCCPLLISAAIDT